MNPQETKLSNFTLSGPPDIHQAFEDLVAERDRLREEGQFNDNLDELQGRLLRLVAAALKGDPPAGTLHNCADLPEVAAARMADLDRYRETLEAIAQDDELAEEGPAFGIHAYRHRQDQARWALNPGEGT